MTPEQQREAALGQIRAVYEDNEAEINGRAYSFHKMQHVERRRVFAFYSAVQGQMNVNNFAFLDTPAFAEVEKVIWSSISIGGELINKRRDHWEEFPEDYLSLVAVAMGVMSYPFIRASGIASASQAVTPPKTKSSKPM
jgi:hypothetical protein